MSSLAAPQMQPFGSLPLSVQRDPTVPSHLKAVLQTIAGYAHGTKPDTFVGNGRIAKDLGKSPGHISRCVRWLEAIGLLIRRRKAGVGSGRLLTLPWKLAGAERLRCAPALSPLRCAPALSQEEGERKRNGPDGRAAQGPPSGPSEAGGGTPDPVTPPEPESEEDLAAALAGIKTRLHGPPPPAPEPLPPAPPGGGDGPAVTPTASLAAAVPATGPRLAQDEFERRRAAQLAALGVRPVAGPTEPVPAATLFGSLKSFLRRKE